MDAKLNHSDISALLSKHCNISQSKADNFVKNFFEIIIEGLDADGIVKINGLGTFKMIDVASRGSVNVNTGEKIEIKGHRKLTFLPSDALKEKVNRPFAMFEPVEVDDDYSDDDEIESEASTTEQTSDTEVGDGNKVDENSVDATNEVTETEAVVCDTDENKTSEAAETSGEKCVEAIPETETHSIEAPTEQIVKQPAKKSRNIIIYTLFILAIIAILFFVFRNSNSSSSIAEPVAPIVVESEVQDTVQEIIVQPDTIEVQESQEIKEFILVEEMNNLSLTKVSIKDTIIYSISGTMTTHRIGHDETLTKISLKYFNDKRLWPYIVQYNKMKNYNQLEIGTELLIPTLVPRN